MTQLNFEQMESLSGGKFWGTSCDSTPSNPTIQYGDYINGQPDLDSAYLTCDYNCQYYILGIAVSSSTQTGGCPDSYDFYLSELN